MTLDELDQLHADISLDAWDLIKRKNADYSAGHDDVLHNFRKVERIGLCDAATATRTRLLDKLARLESVIAGREMSVDEALADTVLDAFNYLVILRAVTLAEKETA